MPCRLSRRGVWGEEGDGERMDAVEVHVDKEMFKEIEHLDLLPRLKDDIKLQTDCEEQVDVEEVRKEAEEVEEAPRPVPTKAASSSGRAAPMAKPLPKKRLLAAHRRYIEKVKEEARWRYLEMDWEEALEAAEADEAWERQLRSGVLEHVVAPDTGRHARDCEREHSRTPTPGAQKCTHAVPPWRQGRVSCTCQP